MSDEYQKPYGVLTEKEKEERKAQVREEMLKNWNDSKWVEAYINARGG